MTAYPVLFTAAKPARFDRVQLLIRIIAFVVLGMVGVSLGGLFALACLALPVFAAIRLASREPAEYLAVDGPRVTRALHWYAAIYAWFALVVDRLPSRSPDETVRVDVEPMGAPTSGTALLRLLLGLPSALALALLGLVAPFVWLWAALTVLLGERVGNGAFRFLAGMQRWSVRLLAYQASLVDAYPPFSFEEAAPAIPARASHPLTAG
jgi:hypothetical protein